MKRARVFFVDDSSEVAESSPAIFSPKKYDNKRCPTFNGLRWVYAHHMLNPVMSPPRIVKGRHVRAIVLLPVVVICE